ncbi:C-module-binding factor isoform B [Micractinium conductrix]|uniref:C-module-binding factor isoform A n=1 Tax=Micractinium conductrix TaxID=554055 RepID=A0A2P6V6W1_9CHLO|nr:C-module-binding factor isoform A [Micractinium conductrix]PSC69822.1 C-module-binding factor isoform B [Micractinium conductrix]|eukprot:PSC69821.1 C-module-binding factor isoform A [Micractinium conductrix]
MGAVQPHAPGVTMQALQAQQLPPPLQQQQAAQAQERGQAVQGQAQGTPTALRFASSEGVSQEALQALVDEVHHIVAALHQMGLRSKADIHALQGLADAALEQSTFGSTNQDHCARCHKPAGLQVLVPQDKGETGDERHYCTAPLTTASSRTPAACWMPAGAWRPLSRLPKLRSRAWRTSATACQRCEHTKGVGTGTPCSQCLTQAQLIATVARLDPVRLEATAQSISVKVPPATGRKQHEAAEEYREREAKRRHQLGKNIVEGALKFKTKYPSTLNLTNAQARLCLLVWQLRQRQDLEWWVDPLMVGLMDRWRTSLLLLGKEGTGSGFHVDPANAFNIALAIDRDLGGVLAYWVFVRPTAKARDAVQAWLNLSKKEGGVGNKGDLYEGKPMLNEQEMMAMEAHFQGTGFIKVIRREAGGLVRVPTGWIHLVFNKQPCVKVAWEVVVASNLALYLHNWRHIGTAPPPTSTVS